MCGNNHWIITPNLTRSIQIDSWPGLDGDYLWFQSVLLGVDTEVISTVSMYIYGLPQTHVLISNILLYT